MSHKNPALAVDGIVIDRATGKLALISRKNPPLGFALPGGFMDVGESGEDAVKREMLEELSIGVFPDFQFHTYTQPNRDPRQHVVSIVYVCSYYGKPEALKAADDARTAQWVTVKEALGMELVFDHKYILNDYGTMLHFGQKARRF